MKMGQIGKSQSEVVENDKQAPIHNFVADDKTLSGRPLEPTESEKHIPLSKLSLKSDQDLDTDKQSQRIRFLN